MLVWMKRDAAEFAAANAVGAPMRHTGHAVYHMHSLCKHYGQLEGRMAPLKPTSTSVARLISNTVARYAAETEPRAHTDFTSPLKGSDTAQ